MPMTAVYTHASAIMSHITIMMHRPTVHHSFRRATDFLW